VVFDPFLNKNEKIAFDKSPVFIGCNECFLNVFKKCKKRWFSKGSKKSFFVMGKRGRFSAKQSEAEDFSFKTEK
jgi:hypothetical protein